MSKALNLVAISGNLTRDPELRTTQGGTSVCSLSVAVNGREKDRQSGNWSDRPDYFEVSVFGATAEHAADWLSKGSHVEISGRLRQDRWQTEAGEKRSAVKIVASDVVFPPKGHSAGGHPPAQAGSAPPVPPPGGDDDDMFPF